MKLIKLNSRSVFYCLICLWVPTFISSCSEEEPEVSVKLSCVDGKHGHAVDLGLSVNWACCNVGANAPEELGGYYAWGETEEKNDYSRENYKWYKGGEFTKYCTDTDQGLVDNKIVLEPEDDVAHVKWGGNWRMPTLEEMEELVKKCSWKLASLNGIKGCKVTGPNGNSIFLPRSRSNISVYWGASLGYSYANAIAMFYFQPYDEKDLKVEVSGGEDREEGFQVRPVCDK